MSVADRVRDIVAPLLGDRGLELYDVEHTGGILRVVVDRDGGVDLDAISEATRAVSRALDDADPIGGRYTLEVTSPGLERTLRTPSHFARAIGSAVKVRTTTGADAERRVQGVLLAADDEHVVIRDDSTAEPHERELRYDEIERARTVFEWGAADKRPHDKKPHEKKRAGRS